MTVLVTGGTGFVGSHLAHQLAGSGAQIRLLARPQSRRDNVQDLLDSGAELAVGDLCDPASLRAAIDGCDTLYHVAADYRLWSRNPDNLYKSNVLGTRHLLGAARDAGVERIVYTSTVGALGLPADGSPGTEETPVTVANMVGHYKRSKYLAEQEALRYADEGLPVIIVNPSTPVGECDIKPTPTGQIIVDFLNRRLPAYVNTGLNLIDVRDVAAGMRLACEKGIPGRKYILGAQNMTLKQVLDCLAEVSGLPAPRVRIPYPIAWLAVGVENLVVDGLLHKKPSHPFEGVRMARKAMFFSADRAVRELGLPQSPVSGALARAVDWFRKNGYVIQ